jgi:hypothetical protein
VVPFFIISDMTLPTSLVATELAAVNSILGAVGQAPVTTIDKINPDVAIAYDTLTDMSREIQGEGWSFNKELEYPFNADTNGNILVPLNALSISLSDIYENSGADVTVRNGMLYNKTTHTYTWDTDRTVKCDVVWYLEFSDLPQAARDYIVARASSFVAIKVIGDPNIQQMLGQREVYARAALIESDCNQGNYSIFGFPNGSNYYNSYQPYRTLAR